MATSEFNAMQTAKTNSVCLLMTQTTPAIPGGPSSPFFLCWPRLPRDLLLISSYLAEYKAASSGRPEGGLKFRVFSLAFAGEISFFPNVGSGIIRERRLSRGTRTNEGPNEKRRPARQKK